MIAIVEGSRGKTRNLFRGTDDSIVAVLLDDDGAPLDVTGYTVTLEVYASSNRSDTPTSIAGTLTAATAGHVTFTIADTDFTVASFSQASYYAYVKTVDGSANIELSAEANVLNLK